MAVTPLGLTLRCYGVGFGDCFLLTFHYGGRRIDRHVLIDFGSTQRPPRAAASLMKAIADDIATIVGRRLHVLVATHRHADHVNGFATNAQGTGPGDVIARLTPGLVVQPWTEVPEAPGDATGPGTRLTGAANDAFRLALTHMREVAAVTRTEARHLTGALRQEIVFLADEGLANRSAVENLARMGKAGRAAYVHHGSRLPSLRTLLPGVDIDVLGPPTIAQKGDVVRQRPRHADEYWHFTRFWRQHAATARLATPDAAEPFPNAEWIADARAPIETRWFTRRLKRVRGQQLLRIVRAMDSALNNTSVILLVRAGGKKLLFPGDAQWENWEYALERNRESLVDVDVYKVGHHGSLNATPKTLWETFARRSRDTQAPGRLCTVMSTRSDSKHGHRENNTEVPRETLVHALQLESDHRSTQELEPTGDLVLTLEFDLT